MGSLSKVDLAYIAGFLDGDGSIMLQLKNRNDNSLSLRFMCTICFYQDRRHADVLYWIRNVVGIGYISHRNDGITELRINGYRRVEELLIELGPYIRLKQKQSKAILKAIRILSSTKPSLLTTKQRKQLISLVIYIRDQNYSHVRKSKRLINFEMTP